MLKDITLGQYFPGVSPIHRADPRTKILALLAFIVSLFISDGPFAYILCALVVVAVVAISKISPKMVLKGLKPVLFIVLFTAVLNIFYTPGVILVQFWIFKITDTGLVNAAYMTTRILLLICSTSLLTYTTSPITLTDGIESLLSPLKKLHVPVHEFAMMMTIALRFIPTLIEETDKIMNAQKARGADFESGNILRRAKALIPVLVPLFISAFRRADELAVAMECRLYHGGEGRTKLNRLKFCAVDAWGAVFTLLIIAALIFLSRLWVGL